MKAFSHLWQYLADFFLEWEIFQIRLQRKSKHTFYVQWLFSKNYAVYGIMSKNMVEPERTQTIWRLSVEYWISKPTRSQHTPALLHRHLPTHTHTHTRTHAPLRMHSSPRARAHTQTHARTVVSWMRFNGALHAHYLPCFKQLDRSLY